jgi:hypothetical protein
MVKDFHLCPQWLDKEDEDDGLERTPNGLMCDLNQFLVKEMEHMQKNPHWTQPVSNPRYSVQKARTLSPYPKST